MAEKSPRVLLAMAAHDAIMAAEEAFPDASSTRTGPAEYVIRLPLEGGLPRYYKLKVSDVM